MKERRPEVETGDAVNAEMKSLAVDAIATP
jgi:hypothetical protein